MKFLSRSSVCVALSLWGALVSQAQIVMKTVGGIDYQLSKVANLPETGTADTTPQNPRGGILQLGNELWFTTYEGGTYDQGSIMSYSLSTAAFTMEYSFGRTIPSDPTTTGYAGANPWKTKLFAGADGTVYYTTFNGGNSGANSPYLNGGAIGSFDPDTIASGVNVIWSGSGAGGTDPARFYAGAVAVPAAGGGTSLYALTYAGGTATFGTVRKVSLDAAGNFVSSTQLSQFTGPNGRQPQGGLVVGDAGKIYFTTGSTTSASATLQAIDTSNDSVMVLSNTWQVPSVAASGGWSTPIFDPAGNSIFTLTLNGQILQYDIDGGTSALLPLVGASAPGNSNFADPILFDGSIYWIKQSASGTGGQLWRYDLESDPGETNLFLLYNLSEVNGNALSQSGSLNIITEGDGTEALYFTTAGLFSGTTDKYGSLLRLAIVPEPSAATLILLASAGLVGRRKRSGNPVSR